MNIGTGGSDRSDFSVIADDAAAWDARLRAPDCTEEDRTRFAAWCAADPANRDRFEHLQTIVASLRHERGRADVRALRDEALRAVRHRRQKVWFGAAAAGFLVLVMGTALWTLPAGERLREPFIELAARLSGTHVYSTGIGQRSTFVLADGSSVELNARSKIHATFAESRRSVELKEGQALFTVAKDPGRPFAVRAGDRHIVAIGTQFDVRLDASSVQVTLIEGKVRVRQSDPLQASSVGDARKEIELIPGEQLVARLVASASSSGRRKEQRDRKREGDDLVREVDVAKVVGWRDGRIFFQDLALQDAVEEMNRHSVLRIRVGDPGLAQIRVNGMFRAGEQEAFVTALKEYFPIATEQRGDREIILVER